MYIKIPVVENLTWSLLMQPLLLSSTRYLDMKPSFLLIGLSAVCLLRLVSGQ